MNYLGQKYDQGPLAFFKLLLLLVSKTLLGLLLELRIVYHTRTYKQTNAINKKQYTNQYKQYKMTLQNGCTRYNDRVSARIG